MSHSIDYMYKIVIIGNSSVGKSSLLKRFTDDQFQQTYLATIGVDFKFKTLQLKDLKSNVKLQIWDTAGQQRFRTITSTYYKGAQGIIIVYDLRNEQTLLDIKQFWINQIKQYGQPNVQLILMGNKSDCQDRKITPQLINQIEQQLDIQNKQVSAKTGSGVHEAFQCLTRKCIKQFGKPKQAKSQTNNVIQQIKKKKAEFQLKSGKDAQVGKKKSCC